MTPSKSKTVSGTRRIVLTLVLAVFLCGLVLVSPATSPEAQASSPEVQASSPEVQADLDWGRMPLCFIANDGYLDDAVAYYVRGADKTLYLASEGLTFVLSAPVEGGEAGLPGAPGPETAVPAPTERWTVRLDYLGASAVAPEGKNRTETLISHFQGSEEDWYTGIPTYSTVAYEGLWEGIDLLYSGTQDQLKQEFILAPGADPDQIRLSYQGATLTLNDQGDLEVCTPVGGFTDEAPVAYQKVAGERVEVEVSYALEAATGSGAQETTAYGFALGDYEPSLPLVIDPAVLVYCGYIGGSSNDYSYNIAVDSSGCAYVTGFTYSDQATFPTTTGSIDTSQNGAADAFVAKVNAAGTALSYCGYIGGSSHDYGFGIAVDAGGNAYVTGYARSTEATFPVTTGSLDTTHNGNDDVFVAKVNAAGTSLDYCGYIGGSGYDYAEVIAVDSTGCAYVTGYVDSTEATFPVTTGSLDTTHNGDFDAFVAKVKADGTALTYCGYIGGNDDDYGNGIAVDGSDCAYVTGGSESTDATFPVTTGSLDTTRDGFTDAFVAKVKADGSDLIYCGYIGGYYDEYGYGIAVDSSGNAYVVGYTQSTEATFPVTTGSLDTTHNGEYDAYVAKVNAAGNALSYCGYIGGDDDDYGYDIAVDSSGNAYITGFTFSTQTSFPVAAGPDMTSNGGCEAFVAKVNAAGGGLDYCGYVGGIDSDYGHGIALDSSGDAYVTGMSRSYEGSLPVMEGPDLTWNGGVDTFVAKLSWSTDTIGEVLLYKRSTGLSKSYEVYEDGTSEKLGKYIWTKKCNQVVPVEIDGDSKSEALLYKASNGRAIFSDLSAVGASTEILKTTWSLGWNRIVAVEVDGDASSELLLHDSTGLGKVMDVDSGGVTTELSSGSWGGVWPHVIPVEIDGDARSEVLLYNKDTTDDTPVAKLTDLSATGVPTQISTRNWGSWTRITPVDLDGDSTDEFFLYRGTGKYKVLDVDTGGIPTVLSTDSWIGGFTRFAVIDIDGDDTSELLAYKKKTGRVILFDLSATGVPTEISRTKWTKYLSHILVVVTAET